MRRSHVPVKFCLLVLVASVACPIVATAASSLVALPENPTLLSVMRDGESYVDVELVGWGPNWSWLGFRGEVRKTDQGTLLGGRGTVAGSGAEIALSILVRQTGPRQLRLESELSTSKDTPLTCIVLGVSASGKRFAGGKVVANSADGTTKETAFPLDKKGVGKAVKQFALVDADGATTNVTLDPPRDVPSDTAARITLAAEKLAADKPVKTVITLDFPTDVTLYAGGDDVPDESGLDRWFEFTPDADHDAPSEIGMQQWLSRPAGNHGRITRRDDQLIYDGQPIKLWGLNVCFGSCAPEKDLAEQRASFYAKYGVNAVRLHKYADGSGWSGILAPDTFTEFDAEGLDRMDYFIAELKKRGIYVKLSPHFGSQKLGRADKQYVPYVEEFGSFSGRDGRITTPHSAVHYSPELQHLQILQMQNLLKHKNPYTGLTYAEDPAIAFIEIINEQSILFYTSMGPLKASPTLRKYVAKRFCDWLRKKYGTHEKMLAAWGGKAALDGFEGDGFPAVGEHLDRDNILPLGNPWYWDPNQLNGSQAFRRVRLLDTMQFLFLLQNEFYARYIKALREAGYEGEVVASNWQAGRAISHFYNLRSDALVGTIDRHNYFGGGSSNRIDNATMLAVPGSGTLSAGMQQVVDRPFMLSEWIHVAPNEWGVEGPALIGAYGLGLQGWDVSFMFQNSDTGTFSRTIGKDRWDVTTPQILGVFPAVARQVLRGDVKQATTQAVCNVCMPSLAEGKLDFEDKVTQQYDVKTFESDKVPAAALAVARCGVNFTETPLPTPAFDVSRYFRDGVYTSDTGQLHWRPGRAKLDGYVTIDTDATQAVVGFAEGQTCKLGDVTIAPKCRYGAIYVTARDLDDTLATADAVLIVAMARARNRGTKIFNGDRIIQRGDGPVVLEPVEAEIALTRPGSPTVTLLDHNGRRTDKTLDVKDGRFEIDGARDRTCYYLVEYPGTN